MTQTNYVRDGHVFEWYFSKDIERNTKLGIIIDPNNINVNIFELNFSKNSTSYKQSCTFYEGVEDVDEPVSQIEPLAHNRSSRVKSRVKFKIVDKEFKYERRLFNLDEYSRLKLNNYNTSGWILNKNKKYAFLNENNIDRNDVFPTSYHTYVSLLWNEYW